MADRKRKRESRARAREEHEIDEMALRGPKSKWQEADAPAAGDPVSEDERRGMDLLGRASVRGGAIAGVGEASAESGIDRPTAAEPDGPRTNPPLREDTGDTGSTGGVAGGARGSGGTDDRGAGTPRGYMEAGPGEQKSTSRFDLDPDETNDDSGE
jgi:hypothetical protein